MAVKPTSIPRWANVGASIVEPSSGKKDIGHVAEEEPPAQFENWLKNLYYQWCDYVDDFENNAHAWTQVNSFSDITVTDFSAGDVEVQNDIIITLGDFECSNGIVRSLAPHKFLNNVNRGVSTEGVLSGTATYTTGTSGIVPNLAASGGLICEIGGQHDEVSGGITIYHNCSGIGNLSASVYHVDKRTGVSTLLGSGSNSATGFDDTTITWTAVSIEGVYKLVVVFGSTAGATNEIHGINMGVRCV